MTREQLIEAAKDHPRASRSGDVESIISEYWSEIDETKTSTPEEEVEYLLNHTNWFSN